MTDQPQIDLAWNDPELDAALFALDNGDPAPALALVRGTVGDPHRRELVVGVLAAALDARTDLVAVVGGEGADDPDRLLLWGAALVEAAATARGSDVVERTSHGQLASMSDLLRQARSVLTRVVERRPDDTAAHECLGRCAQLEPYEPDEVRRRYEARVAAGPLTAPSVLGRVNSLAPRWHGAPGEMLEYARAQVADLPDGDPRLAAIALAHIEEWVEKGLLGKLSFGFRARWRGEVDAASDRLLAGRDSWPSTMYAHQVFACLYSIVDDENRIRRHLERGGPRAAQFPWVYRDDDPAAELARLRTRAGLA